MNTYQTFLGGWLLFGLAALAPAQPDSVPAATDTGSATLQVEALKSVEQQKKRIGKLFEKVLPTLEKTRTLVDRHEELPDSTLLPFSADKKSNQLQINKFLDQAIDMLELSSVTDYRQRIRMIQENVKQSHAQISEYRRKRISSPKKSDLSSLERANPFISTVEYYDEQIQELEAKIKEDEGEQKLVKQEFKKALNDIGLKVTDEEVDSLLSSVSGDDFVSMVVVFDNVKQLTTQLQSLTDESGEDLDVAKRYYGMYLVMVQVMDRLQHTFVEDITNDHIPKLKEYAQQAQDNITEAQKLIETSGGDIEILQSNMFSNDVTYKAANLYINYLKEHAQTVKMENEQTKKNLATASNTYKTVKLSSQVSTRMKVGRQNFESLMRLKVPVVREFGNDAIRKEFQRMTEELRQE